MTRQEVKRWAHLRTWRERGYHFRRQSPRSNYIVDFVCMRYRMIIELDGGQHNFDAHAARDAMRDRRLSKEGFTVLRFLNHDVDRNLDGVLERIEEVLKSLPTRPRRGHPPPAGEG